MQRLYYLLALILSLGLSACHSADITPELVQAVTPLSDTAYVAKSADFYNNAYDDALTGTAARHHSALARVKHRFAAGIPTTPITLQLFSNIFGRTYPATSVGIAVFVDGNYVTVATPTAADAAQSFQFSLTSNPAWATGSHTIEFVEPFQEELTPLHFAGTSLLTVDYGQGVRYQVEKPTACETLFSDSDSIGVGTGTDIAQRDGMQANLASLLPGLKLVSLGAGSRNIQGSYDTPAKRKAMISRVVAYAQSPGITKAKYLFALGVNDASHNHDIATVCGYAGQYLDELHAALPDLQIYLQTPLPAASNGVESLPAWRSGLAALGATRPWLPIIDGAKLLSNPSAGIQTADGIHPNNAGARFYAQNLAPQLR